MSKTSIPWADYTWNPITGCTKGCEYCYARGIAKRFGMSGTPDSVHVIDTAFTACEGQVFPYGFAPTIYPHRLDEPLRLKKPSRIFLGSMGDLFDPAFPDEFRDRIFATVAATPQHTYLLLTKQSRDMRRYFADEGMSRRIWTPHGGCAPSWVSWPISNLWLGVTVTNQADADERIPLLLDTPAAHRFVSVEPMLGPVDLRRYLSWGGEQCSGWCSDGAEETACRGDSCGPGLDFVAAGAKTPGKPLHTWLSHQEASDRFKTCDGGSGRAMLRSLRDQCLSAGVPFMYKHGGTTPMLDGVVHDAMPGGDAGCSST